MEYNEFESSSQRKTNPFLPLVFGAILIIGILIGYLFSFRGGNSAEQFIKNAKRDTRSGEKMGSVIDYIYTQNVDTINKKALEEKALTSLFHSLDPHSDFIPASEFQQMNEPLQGGFEGI